MSLLMIGMQSQDNEVSWTLFDAETMNQIHQSPPPEHEAVDVEEPSVTEAPYLIPTSMEPTSSC